jgi:hypothetical protein
MLARWFLALPFAAADALTPLGPLQHPDTMLWGLATGALALLALALASRSQRARALAGEGQLEHGPGLELGREREPISAAPLTKARAQPKLEAEETGAARPIEPPGEVVRVVLAAAVAAVLPEPHRLISVRPVRSLDWSVEGRRQIFASHVLIRR